MAGPSDITYENVGPRTQLTNLEDGFTSQFVNNSPLADSGSTAIPSIRHFEVQPTASTATDPSLVNVEFSNPTSDFFLAVIDMDHGDTSVGNGDGDIVTVTARDGSGSAIDLSAQATVVDACDYTSSTSNPSPSPAWNASTGEISSRDPDRGNRNIIVFTFGTDVKEIEFDFVNPETQYGEDHVYYALFHSTTAYQSGPGCTNTTLSVTDPVAATPPAVTELGGQSVPLAADVAGTDPVDIIRWFAKSVADGTTTTIATVTGTNLQNSTQTATFDATSFGGDYKIFAKARSAPSSGTVPPRWVTSSSIDVEFIVPLTLLTPTANSTISDNFDLTVAADTTNLDIQRVKYYFDGVEMGTGQPQNDFKKTFYTYNLPNGTYTVTARARIGSSWSNDYYSAPVANVTILNLAVTSPEASSTMTGDKYPVSVEVDPALNVDRVKYILTGDGVTYERIATSATNLERTIDTMVMDNGVYTVTAQAKIGSSWSVIPVSPAIANVTISN